jgi:large repetitive protein
MGNMINARRFFPAGVPIRVRIDLQAGTGTSSLKFGWGLNGAAVNLAVGAQLKPGFWYPTKTTVSDTTGSTQVPATQVTETKYNDGTMDPVYAIPTSTTVDPTGLALKTVEAFEAPGTGMLRRTMRTLPAFATGTAANSTTYSYYLETATAADPCVTGSAAVPQVGLLQFTQGPTPATGTAVKTETVYDLLGRPVASRYVGDTAWTCTSYDARGRVYQIVIPANSTTPAGRTITTVYKAGSVAGVGGDPYRTTVADSAGTITTVVDALGRTVSTTDVWGVTTASSYDQAGRLTQAVTTIASPAYTATMAYTYDSVNRLLTQKLDGNTLATLVYSPDNAALDPGKLTDITYPSGAGNAGNGTKGTIGYDTLGQINLMTWKTAANVMLTSDEVTRSITGRVLTNKVDGAATPAWTYTYDTVGRLTGAVGSSHNYQYAYAATGGCGTNTAAGKNTNRTTLTDNAVAVANYCYDNADRLTSTTQTGYTAAITYDAHGNTTSLAGETYGYDYADRHTTTTKAAVRKVDYVRDASNRIVSRTDTNLATTVAVTQRYGFTGSGDSSSLTLTTANAVTEAVFSLPGGVLYTKRTASPVWSYPNIHGDITATTDNAGVKQGVTRIYNPYGELITGVLADNLTGDLDNNWLGQHQRPLEHATGLALNIEMGARIYNPIIGRFLQVDPISGGATDSDYGYVSDPVNEFDLTGTMCFSFSCAKKAVSKAWDNTGGRVVSYVDKHAGNFARRALDNKFVRGIAIGAAIGVFCGATAGIGCAMAVGAVAGGALGAANYKVNHKQGGLGGNIVLGMIQGATTGVVRQLGGLAGGAGSPASMSALQWATRSVPGSVIVAGLMKRLGL